MWSAVKGMGGVMGKGAFYFLVPVPVEEDRAIDVLAKQWGVLTTPGRYDMRSSKDYTILTLLEGGTHMYISQLDSVLGGTE